MIMALLGFLAPFIPDLIGFGKQWMDHKQELQMMQIRHEQAKEAHSWRLEALHTEADIAIEREIRKPHKPYSVGILREGSENPHVWRWSFNLIFLMFGFLDWLISSVRPGVTYWIFGLYGAYKTATIYTSLLAALRFAELQHGEVGLLAASEAVGQAFAHNWKAEDWEMLWTVLGFWFGDRTRSKARANLARV